MDRNQMISKENLPSFLLCSAIGIFLLIIYLLFGKIHLILFTLLLIFSYKLTDSYVTKIQQPKRTLACWPNLLILYDTTERPDEELQRKQNLNCDYIRKNPWIHLMISKRVDEAIDEFCGLCLRDFIYPWLSTITHDDSLVHESKHAFRYLLATVIRRVQTVNINQFILDRLIPLIFQTCDRFVAIMKSNPSLSSAELLRRIYADDLHLAMFNRRTELKYLRTLLSNLMLVITPKYIVESNGSRHFLRELCVGQIFLNAFDSICQPATINRLIHLYFTTSRQGRSNSPIRSQEDLREFFKHFCAMNGSLHKNRLTLDLTDVMYEKELMNQFSRVLDRHGSLGLLSIYLSLTDVLNEIPFASDRLVRQKISQRLKHIDERYLNPRHPHTFLALRNPYDDNDSFIDDLKTLIYQDFEQSLEENNPTPLDIQRTFTLLSKFHCRIYELVVEKYQRCFLSSDEHFLYICGPRMDSPDYHQRDQNFDEIALDFVHIEEIRTTAAVPTTPKYSPAKHYTTTSYKELEEKEEVNAKSLEDTASISSSTSLDERDLSTWRIHISHAEELRESMASNSKYAVFIIEVQRNEGNQDNSSTHDDERPRWVVARRYQDFYLLEQKLTEFHGIFSNARLPPRKTTTAARTVEFLQSVKGDFEHFLRHLLSQSTLRNSELLYNFLIQPDEFSLPNSEIILTKMFKVVPRRLRIEKGQSLEPFLISLLNYAEPAKPKATQPIPIFNDIVEEKLNNSIYGNNADITEPVFQPAFDEPVSSTTVNDIDSTYDHLICIIKQVFSASPFLIHLLDLCRVPLRNTFDAYFSHFIEHRMDDVLSNDENFVDIIHSLKDVLFPNDAKDKGPTDLVNFDDVVAAAENFLPDPIRAILGPTNVKQGFELVLQYFQDPLLNKQLLYMILDEILLELFPELQSSIDQSRKNTMTSI